MKKILDKLFLQNNAEEDELIKLIHSSEYDEYLFSKASQMRKKYYGDNIYIRGLIEISSYCKNDCYYCGIRASNKYAQRFRLMPEQILSCCDKGYELGFRSFVLQGGEDVFYTDKLICSIVSSIKEKYPDCAVTLSMGEKNAESYLSYRRAGADRYLLRHETANSIHYGKLHPKNMSLKNRKECLFNLKKAGFQVGAGFMVGSPFQTMENLIEDLRFLQELQPEMIGIGPFISHKDTSFSQYGNGSAELTLRMIAIIRLMFPAVLLPATTALATLLPDGRERGIKAGANVLMPNLSPVETREKYSLYDNKIHSGEEAAESLKYLKQKISSAGCNIPINRGDYAGLKNN